MGWAGCLLIEPGWMVIGPEVSVSNNRDAVAAVVLAAGASIRMGSPKSMLPWGKMTVIEHIVQQARASGIVQIVVISGAAHREITAALLGKPVQIVLNSDFAESEMLGSLKLGLKNLSQVSRAALVVLGDQPQIKVETIVNVLEAYSRTQPALVVPSYQNRRGHPWLMDRRLWSDVLSLEPPETLRNFLNAHSSEICYLDCPDDTILRDLDTLEDYEREQKLY